MQILNAQTTEALQEIVLENMDLVIDSGFTKPLTKIDLKHKEQIIQCVTMQKVILVSLAELSQFRDGLYKILSIF